jgi:hypothetical protein
MDMSMETLGFDLGLIIETFDIQTPDTCVSLTEWLHSSGSLNDHEQWLFERLYTRTRLDSGYWNEEELKVKFIGALFEIVDFDTDTLLKVFYERKLSATVKNYALHVKADCLIARPRARHSMKTPFFFLQEFKRRQGEKNDPEAQMLTAMLIAQELNGDSQPIYGGVLFGNIWQFATLNGQNYCLSQQFDATKQAELMHIVFILRKLKALILARPN